MYKRQERERAAFLIPCQGLRGYFAKLLFSRRFLPVSYTHLDVYKRQEEDRYDFVRDILIRYKDLKRIYGYKIKDYWRNIASVDDYYLSLIHI